MTISWLLGGMLGAGIVVGNAVSLFATIIFFKRTEAGRRFIRNHLGPPAPEPSDNTE
ncbi:hypothetical protein [Novacetimonas pomaceti]|uniref:hypothetical protein n=1 Tax=Novacetimonas pomaceti TaxID=2021998 RepID=UPI001C2D62E8|nr:hypothetical protein [Novacetimonas pomaceti]MBV1833099.1 hypothetical protein [Novacetimonas pomaceti]